MRRTAFLLAAATAGLGMLASPSAFAKLNVVTTITDLKTIAEEVGRDLVSVDAIAKDGCISRRRQRKREDLCVHDTARLRTCRRTKHDDDGERAKHERDSSRHMP